jgi:hypothetical protein
MPYEFFDKGGNYNNNSALTEIIKKICIIIYLNIIHKNFRIHNVNTGDKAVYLSLFVFEQETVRKCIRKMEHIKGILIKIFFDEHLLCALVGIIPDSRSRNPGFKCKPRN